MFFATDLHTPWTVFVACCSNLLWMERSTYRRGGGGGRGWRVGFQLNSRSQVYIHRRLHDRSQPLAHMAVRGSFSVVFRRLFHKRGRAGRWGSRVIGGGLHSQPSFLILDAMYFRNPELAVTSLKTVGCGSTCMREFASGFSSSSVCFVVTWQ